MKHYFKKTWCGMILMIERTKYHKNDYGHVTKTYTVFEKATEKEAQELFCNLKGLA